MTDKKESEKNDIFKDAKRINLFDQIFVGIGNGKIIFKDLENPNEHQTIKFREDGVIDFHLTTEGNKKKYQSQGKFDLLKLANEIAANPAELEKIVLGSVLDGAKLVNFQEPEYSHLQVFDVKDSNIFASIAQKTKRKVNIPIERLSELDLNKIPWKDAKDKITKYGMVYDKENLVGVVAPIVDKFLFLSLEALENSPLLQMINKVCDIENLNDNDRK